MAARQKSRFWRLCRIYFRRFRIMVWLLVLALLGALVYVNQIGLPGFIKKPLLEKLHARGIDLQFSRLRWRWYQGIVAENVRFGQADERMGPQLTLREVQVQLNHKALRHFHLQVDSLALRQGQLMWPFISTNQEMRQLSVQNIRTYLRLLPNDEWELQDFTAGFAGAKIRLFGTVTNASAAREWKFPQARKGPDHAPVLRERLTQLADTLDRIHFSAPPELVLNVRGDARDLQSFEVRLVINTPGAKTPWGEVTEGRFIGHIFPATSNGLARADLTLEAADARTPWANCTNLALRVHAAPVEGQTNVIKADLFLRAGQVETQWGSATNASFKADWLHALTNAIPLEGNGDLFCPQADTKWGSGKDLRLSGHLHTPPLDDLPAPDESWAAWGKIQPYRLDLEAHLGKLDSPNLQAEDIVSAGNWRAPQLSVTNLHARLYNGELDASATLDAATRVLSAKLKTDVDPHKVEPLLTEGARRWLSQFSWSTSPDLQAQVSLILPPWKEKQPNWRVKVQPTLQIIGEFRLDHPGAFLSVPFAGAHSHFIYSNMVWHLPDLTASRPEGQVQAFHFSNDRTKNFYWRVHSTVDPAIARTLLPTNTQTGLDFFAFTQPPDIQGEIWGRWHNPGQIGFKGQVALTNFSFRGQSVDHLTTALQFTNRICEFTNTHAQIGTQELSAASLIVDIPAKKIYLTNGFGFADPGIVTRAIGTHVAKVMEPYVFEKPPIARVHGIIPMHEAKDADLYFDVDGGAFHFWKFDIPHIAGNIHWAGDRLTLSNVRARAYGGSALGSAAFDFRPHAGADFHFTVLTTNMLLQSLIADLATRSNHLEGTLDTALVVTKANTETWQKSIEGYANINLHDGLIWDIPIFGVFSKVLNEIAPGLGSSRASAGTGSFGITNGVIRSDDLEIRSLAARLLYRGTVDFQSRVNARVEAELLRDLWGVGPLISTVFWPVTKMWEYRVTGTLGQPKTEPLYFIPKIVLMPFHPLRTFKDLIPQEPSLSDTNAPSKTP